MMAAYSLVRPRWRQVCGPVNAQEKPASELLSLAGFLCLAEILLFNCLKFVSSLHIGIGPIADVLNSAIIAVKLNFAVFADKLNQLVVAGESVHPGCAH
jgi:hypothetical protein